MTAEQKIKLQDFYNNWVLPQKNKLSPKMLKYWKTLVKENCLEETDK